VRLSAEQLNSRTAERKGRKGFAKDAKGIQEKVHEDGFLSLSIERACLTTLCLFRVFREPLRPLRSAVRFQGPFFARPPASARRPTRRPKGIS
jgi:hypothetical protein